MGYRKIWEDAHGEIPVDEQGRKYEIHHIDGNPKNNDLVNLTCVSIADHYIIHYEQGDWMACAIMSKRMGLSPDETKRIHKMAMSKRDQTGDKNPMYGRSAVSENNLKWYNDGIKDTMFAEGSQPEGYVRGRINMPDYDKTGKNNPMYGRSAVKEKNLKWYTNGTENIYVTENTQPASFKRGRTMKKKEVPARYEKV